MKRDAKTSTSQLYHKTPVTKLQFSFIGILSSFAILLGMYFLDLVKNPYDYVERTPYQDKNVNFTLQVPTNWVTIPTDSNEIEKAVKDATGGTIFDLLYYPLESELTPVTFMQPSKSEDEPFKELMFLSFFGSDDDRTFMSSPKTMEEDFQQILTDLGNKSIKLTNSEILETPYLTGYLLQAEGHLDGNKIYYTQYLEPIGSNYIRVLHSEMEQGNTLEDIEVLLSSMYLIPTGVKDAIIGTDYEEETPVDKPDVTDDLTVGTSPDSDFEVQEVPSDK